MFPKLKCGTSVMRRIVYKRGWRPLKKEVRESKDGWQKKWWVWEWKSENVEIMKRYDGREWGTQCWGETEYIIGGILRIKKKKKKQGAWRLHRSNTLLVRKCAQNAKDDDVWVITRERFVVYKSFCEKVVFQGTLKIIQMPFEEVQYQMGKWRLQMGYIPIQIPLKQPGNVTYGRWHTRLP